MSKLRYDVKFEYIAITETVSIDEFLQFADEYYKNDKLYLKYRNDDNLKKILLEDLLIVRPDSRFPCGIVLSEILARWDREKNYLIKCHQADEAYTSLSRYKELMDHVRRDYNSLDMNDYSDLFESQEFKKKQSTNKEYREFINS